MYIRVMGMPVHEWRMSVRVAVWLPSIPLAGMLVLMMSIVPVGMSVGQRLVGVLVLVDFGKVQPDADGHQRRCQPERPRGRLTEGANGDCSADEGRRGEIGAGTR